MLEWRYQCYGWSHWPEKTCWFVINFFWTGLNWDYHTKESLSGDITLPDKDGVMHMVMTKEPTSAYTSFGLRLPLSGEQTAA